MRVLKVGFIVFLEVLILNVYVFSQFKEELIFIVKNNSLTQKKEISHSLFKDETSELKLVFIGIIRFYQLFISSQDQHTCNFTESCSRFGISAIKKYGIFYGLLIASDRVQRCNVVGRKYYPIDKETGLSIDYPVEEYSLGQKRKEGRRKK